MTKPHCTHRVCNSPLTGNETQAEIEQVLACMTEMGKIELVRHDPDGEAVYRLVEDNDPPTGLDMSEAIKRTKQLILEFMPNEIDVLDEKALGSAAFYLNENGYLSTQQLGDNATTSQAYLVYDVIKFTNQNTTA